VGDTVASFEYATYLPEFLDQIRRYLSPCGLFKDVSISDETASKDWMAVSKEFERIWKNAVMR
jgi:hypothetical protein